MTTVEVNKNQYQQHHDYVYDSDEEDEVASLYDLNLYKRQHLKSRRRVRAEAVRSFDSLVDSSVEQNQSIQVECVKCSDDPDNAIEYRLQDLNVLWNNRVHEPNTALIAIEACHISPWDMATRQGHYKVATPYVLGSNFVGVVHSTSSEASQWRVGRRVAGLPLKGGNATYITATPDQLFDVPKKLDASEVACTLSIYLPAFQALHHGQPRPWRYSQETLQRKRVLITGTSNALPETWAMVRLAQYGGASEVYVVCEREQHSTLRQHLYALPLDAHMDDWLPAVRGRMDVVIDFDYVLNEWASCRALAPNGRLVWYRHPSKRETGHLWLLDGIWEQTKMCLLDRASMYDLYESHCEDFYAMKMDFEFLMRLLAQRQIRPKIDQYIGLDGVQSAHKDLQTQTQPLSGAIVCEPWKDTDVMSNVTYSTTPSLMSE